jgi:hypothetical protein
VFLMLCCLCTAAAAEPKDAGWEIYTGRVSDGFASVGAEAQVPASRFGCISCHGGDGLGGREGGYVAPAITREWLESATSARPAYDFTAFARLIATGVYPSGEQAAVIMPRYKLSPDALASLYAYLGRVEQDDRAGVEDGRISLGVVYDPGEAEAGEKVRASLLAALLRLGDPQVHGRTIAIKAYSADDPRLISESSAAIMPVAAIDASAKSGWAQRLPVIAPVRGTRGDEDARRVRGVQASSRDQWKALAADAPPDAPVVFPPSMSAATAAAEARLYGLTGNRRVESLDGWAHSGRQGSLLLLGGLGSARPPRQSLAGITVLSTLDGSASGVAAWRAEGAGIVLADARPVNRGNNQIPDLDRVADASLRVALEMLARTGRDVTRTRFMSSFDNAKLTLPNWAQLDYGSFRLGGTDEVSLLRLPGLTP